MMRGSRVWIAVPSCGRADSVRPLQDALGCSVSWYAPEDEWDDYCAAGAHSTRVGGRDGVTVVRNRILDEAFTRGCDFALMLDDDYCGASYVLRNVGSHRYAHEVPLAAALSRVLMRLQETDFLLAGRGEAKFDAWRDTSAARVVYNSLMTSQVMLVRRTPLRFDSRMYCMADADYCLQHLKRYGGLVRVDEIHCRFHAEAHDGRRAGGGGYTSTRPGNRYNDAIDILESKWGWYLRGGTYDKRNIIWERLTPSPRHAIML